MNATVINHHHFCKGINLTVQNGKPKWEVNWKDQKYKYGTGPFAKVYPSREHKILDPVNSLDDFILLIELVFEFTGCSHFIKIESQWNLTLWDLVSCIYNTPLEHNVKFVHIGYCGCNMAHCGAITSINIDNNEYKTYGDLMKLFGTPVNDGYGHTYYEYPDSVFFFLEKITELPERIHVDGSCYNGKIPVTEKLDPNNVYLTWSYCR